MLTRIGHAIENTLIALCKAFGRFKLTQFLGLYLTWQKTERWLAQDNLPALKREMILVMQDATLIGLQHLNWWVPKKRFSNTAPPDPDKIRQAAFLERMQQRKE